MVFALLLGGALLVAVLLSGTALRLVLSPALVFLAAGAFAARLGWFALRPDSPLVDGVIDVALFAVLFAAGASLPREAPGQDWTATLRTVALGLPLTAGAAALLAYALGGFDVRQALIIGVALAPTGPLLATASGVSGPLRTDAALRVALAVTVLVQLIAAEAGGNLLTTAALPLAGGLALGTALPALGYLLVRLPGLGPAAGHPLALGAVVLLVYAVAQLTGVNAPLAAFAAGALLGGLFPERGDDLRAVAEPLAWLAGHAALLVLGALLTPALFRTTPALTWLAVGLVVVAVRPLGTALGLVRSAPAQTVLAAGWLAPKVLTTAVLTLLVLRSGLPEGALLYGFLAACVVAAVLVHAVVDVTVTGFGEAPELVELSAGSATWMSSARSGPDPGARGNRPPTAGVRGGRIPS